MGQVEPALANEIWDPHLRGVDEGLLAGMLPPKGVYLRDDTYLMGSEVTNSLGQRSGQKVDIFAEAPALIWNPGFKVLGASYAVAVAQPVDWLGPRNTAYGGVGNWGSFNTLLVPASLSWSLPHDLHIATTMTIAADDASAAPGRLPRNVYVGSGNGFWSFEPALGVTWFHDGWNVSLETQYAANTTNHRTHYYSADQFSADYTVTKTIGRWTLGAGAYQQNQLAEDKKLGRSLQGSMAQNFGLGPIVGYNFGKVSVMAIYNRELMTNNDVGGDFLNIRLVLPL